MTRFESVRLSARTHVGSVRENNEDSIGCTGWMASDRLQADYRAQWEVKALPCLIAVVADGIGGHRAGEVASHMVVEGLCSEPSPFDGEPVRADLERRIVGVHETIKKRSADHVELLGMGSTVAGLLLSADRLLHFNVGDSRVYVQQAGELSQLSVDDCPAVGEFGRSHILTQALGGHSSPRPHLGEIQPAAGQKYLLCSDGLSDMVGDREIAGCLSNITDPVDHLLQSALDGGGRDNISLILIELF